MALADFTFRIKLPKSSSGALLIDEPRFEWPVDGGERVLVLSSGSDDVALKDSNTFYFTSAGWPSERAAWTAADRYVPVLARTLARLRVGVDLGVRATGGGGMTKYTRDKMLADHGLRVINDALGVMVYESEPRPVFSSMSASLSLGISAEIFARMFEEAVVQGERLTEREIVALDLFNASLFQRSTEARFLMLIIAVEAILEPAPRSPAAIAHAEDLIQRTVASVALSESERQSIRGALQWLKHESIGQTGRKLVSTKLKGRKYMEMAPDKFFSHCYELRSRLVHGVHPLPTRSEIGSAAASLEVLVSDLLAGDLRNVPLV